MTHLCGYFIPSIQDHTNVLIQMMWISICLLESDFEYEFLFAVKLLDQLVPSHIDFAKSDHVEKLRSVLQEVSRLRKKSFLLIVQQNWI